MLRPANDDAIACASGSLGAALEQLMSAQCLPARWVRRVYRAAELPLRLQHLLCTAGPETAWRAFTDDSQWWFGLAVERACSSVRPALEFDAHFFCQDGLLWASARWSHTSDAGLALREVYGPPALEFDRALESLALRPIASVDCPPATARKTARTRQSLPAPLLSRARHR